MPNPNEGIGEREVSRGEVLSKEELIVLVERRPFLREAIGRSMKVAFSTPVETFSTLSELANRQIWADLIVMSLIEADDQLWETALEELSEYPSNKIVVLASANNFERAKAAIQQGAKGYIPLTMGFDVAMQAVRFVLAGGTYAPTDHLNATHYHAPMPAKSSQPIGVLTNRENSVVAAIRKGKSNKIIAYDLNMSESTVKVHVRNVMKKLNARNRTEVAMRA